MKSGVRLNSTTNDSQVNALSSPEVAHLLVLFPNAAKVAESVE